MTKGIGQRFAEAIAAKDEDGLLDLLDPDLDFKGLTPGRFWEASSAKEVVHDIILGKWFEPQDEIEALEHVDLGSVVDRGRVSYLLRLRTPDGSFLCEQQAYFGVDDDHINWLRVLCSGFRPVS
jgi:hypothetical protein